jgi:hypothetical protein
VQRILEQVMDGHERRKRIAAVAAAIRAADASALSTWRAESAEWSAVGVVPEAKQ